MEYTIINGELYHHGIKGQRWGVRRFQTKSGSLTSAGRKRYGVGKGDPKKKAAAETKKTENTKAADKKKSSVSVHEDYAKAHAKKPVQSMSNDELRAVNSRLAMEETYKKYNPPKKSLGRKFLDDFIMPAAKDIAKDYVKRYMKEGASYLEKSLNNKTSDKSKDKSSDNKDSSDNKNDSSGNKTGGTGKKGMKWEKRTKTEKETYEGPINIKGEGTSKRTSSDSKSETKKYSKIYTNDWEEHRESYTSAPGFSETMLVFRGMTEKMSNYAPQASLGQAFISGFLEPPRS